MATTKSSDNSASKSNQSKDSSNKYEFISFRVSKEQSEMLEAKANSLGFRNKSSFIRSSLFLNKSIFDKIDEIYERICRNES